MSTSAPAVPAGMSSCDPMLELKAQDLLREEISFIYSKEFDEPTFLREDREKVDRILKTTLWPARSRRSTRGIIFSGLSCLDTPLLKPDQERSFFRLLNYERYRANALRSQLDPHRPSRQTVRQIERHMARAEVLRNRIIESNSRLVLSVARQSASSHQQFEELTSEGFVILLGAIDKFDYSRGFRFSTYATYALQRHFYRVWRRSQKQNERFVSTPTDLLNDVLPIDAQEPVELDAWQTGKQVWQLAEQELDDREQAIIRQRFGLDGGKPKTLREVASQMGISKERVRQLQIKALEKLEQLTLRMGLRNAIVDHFHGCSAGA